MEQRIVREKSCFLTNILFLKISFIDIFSKQVSNLVLDDWITLLDNSNFLKVFQ